MAKTAICRECQNYVPEDRQVDGSRRAEDGTVVCRECNTVDHWSDF